jgi:hypothetical protein
MILVGKNMEEDNNRLDDWRLALEGKELIISKNKTEYIEYAFGGKYQKVEGIEINDNKR